MLSRDISPLPPPPPPLFFSPSFTTRKRGKLRSEEKREGEEVVCHSQTESPTIMPTLHSPSPLSPPPFLHGPVSWVPLHPSSSSSFSPAHKAYCTHRLKVTERTKRKRRRVKDSQFRGLFHKKRCCCRRSSSCCRGRRWRWRCRHRRQAAAAAAAGPI